MLFVFLFVIEYKDEPSDIKAILQFVSTDIAKKKKKKKKKKRFEYQNWKRIPIQQTNSHSQIFGFSPSAFKSTRALTLIFRFHTGGLCFSDGLNC